MSEQDRSLTITNAGTDLCTFQLHHKGLIKWLKERNLLTAKSNTYSLYDLLVLYSEPDATLTAGGEVQEPLDQFFAALAQERQRLQQRAVELRRENKTGLLELLYALPDDEPIVVSINRDTEHGALVKSVRLVKTLFGHAIVVYFRYVMYDGRNFVYAHGSRTIFKSEAMDFATLPVRPMSAADAERLQTRSTFYQQVNTDQVQRQYHGLLARIVRGERMYYQATGKVMIDVSSFKQLQPNYNGFYGMPAPHTNPVEADMKDPHVAACCSPYVYGFSFTAKRWGEMLVDSISAATYRQDAFARLVIPSQRKKLIRAIGSSQQSSFKDLIDGKGGGYIVLLSGKPGVGKTLTAEAIAEELQRPLYMVSCGELGTTAQNVEEKLSEIFEMATIWNALVLLDECDIFLQRRTKKDVHRNCLVAVFLRLLEYFPGILFLTTNRAKNLDEAFTSRITVSLRYRDLNRKARLQVWRQLAQGHPLTAVNFKKLSRHKLNGREIKHCLKLAVLHAQQTNRPATTRDIEAIITLWNSGAS